MLGVRHGLAQQRANVIVMQRVDHLPPVPLTDDKPEMTQNPQLLRHG